MNAKRAAGLILILSLLMNILFAFNPLIALCSQNDLFVIVNVFTWSSSGSTSIYPGSRRINLRIEAMYTGEAAYSVFGHLETVKGIDFSAGSGATVMARSPNGSFVSHVKMGDYVVFEYYLDVSKSISPGTYTLKLNITYRLESNQGDLRHEAHDIEIEISGYPELNLSVIEAYLNPASYPGSVNTNLYVLMENSGGSNIVSAIFIITLPEGFVIRDPRARVGAVNSGERFTVTFSGISVPLSVEAGTYNAMVYANAVMRTEDGVSYNSTAYIPVQFNITGPPKEDPIIISSVSILYQGSPAPLLPSASGVTIRVTMINRLPETVSGMVVIPRPPMSMTVRSLSGTYVNGMAPGGSCFIDMTVDVSQSAGYGLASIPLEISFVRIVSGASYLGEQKMSISVFIESPHSYIPEISLASAYWGSPEPAPVYSGSRYAPLTLHFINDGRYDIVGAVVGAHSTYLRPIKGSDVLATRLTPGSHSTVTLYFDVNAEAGEVPLNISVDYVFEEFGVHLPVARSFRVYLPVEEYPASASSLMIVSSGWQNNYNVFPRTENAVYQVVIANRAPFPASGIILRLDLPKNMSSRGDRAAMAYVEGPIRSLDTFTASFMITVGDVKPGRYRASLAVDFILLSGGPGTRRSERFDLDISVNDDSKAVEFISASWYEGSVGPNTYGAHLIISVRNVHVDAMRGAILEASLPRGMLNALDNSSLIRAPPLSMGLPSASPQVRPQDLSAIIDAYLRAAQLGQGQVFNRGDILTFVLNVHLLDVDVGAHNISGIISYIDQWGTKRSVRLTIPVAVLGRTAYINVYMSGSLSIRSSFTNVSLIIENSGTSPLYDVFLAVSPYQGAPLLIASPAVKHIEKVDAGGRVEVPMTLVYNPFGFVSQVGGVTVVTYGAVPLMTTIVYKDASGSLKMFNNTITVVVEPFIELVIRDVRAVSRHGFTTVSGVVVNYGSATARMVKATFRVGNNVGEALIGNVHSADEAAFRVEVSGYGDSGILRIEYYDDFNQKFSKEMMVDIERLPETPAAQPAGEGLSPELWIVVGAVAVFLAMAFFLIYRTLKSRPANKT